MGCSNSKVEPSKGPSASFQPGGTTKGVGGGRTGGNRNFKAIEDKFETLEEVSDSLKVAGLESSNLVRGDRLSFFPCAGGGSQRGTLGVDPFLLLLSTSLIFISFCSKHPLAIFVAPTSLLSPFHPAPLPPPSTLHNPPIPRSLGWISQRATSGRVVRRLGVGPCTGLTPRVGPGTPTTWPLR